MTNNQIIEELISTGFVKNYVRKRCIGWESQEDIEQDVYLILLEYDLLQEIYKMKGINGIRQIASGIIQRHVSEKGKANRLYKRELAWTQNEIPDLGYEQKQNIY